MQRKKDIVTIFVDKNTSHKEIKEIRELYKDIRLNIIISGEDKFKNNLKEFLKARII